MERYVKSDDRNQLSLIPMSLDDMIPEDAEVRALEVIVEKMDIRSLDFKYTETKQTGRPPFDPVDMFKLNIYSYFNGIRSSRKIERECYRNIELMWLIGNLKPDFKTIANFRRDNKSQIKRAFQAFSIICDQLGMIGKEIVAVDGSKFRACNSRDAYYSEKKIDQKLAHYNKAAAEYLKLLDACDREESDSPKFTKDELVEKLDKINTRISELTIMRDAVVENGNICETDTESRMMRTANSGADICHNVQIAVDSKNHMVVAVDVTSQPIDKEQLYNMSAQAKANMGVETLTVVADKGYYSASQFKDCSENGIIPIVPKTISGHIPAEEFDKTAFVYDAEKGGYICPTGIFLSPFKSRKASAYTAKGYIKYANISACKQCQQKSKCTSGKYRMIQDNPLQKYSREVDKRVKDNPKAYLLRKQLAEHPFGTIKRALGFTYFLTIGTESVRAEALLHFLIYNMKRAINQMGTAKLIEALQG